MGKVDRLDRYQRRHGWLGAPLAVVYKFAEDRGPYLAALVAYYAFVSLFPLLLVFSSTLGFFLEHNEQLRRSLERSALSDFPVIGTQLRTSVGNLHGNGLALALGVLGTLYGGLGVMQAAQTAFNRIYAVPRNEQPNPLRSRLRSLGLLLLLGFGVLLSSGAAAVSNGAVSHLGPRVRAVGYVFTFLVNAAVFAGAFQLLTARELRWREVMAGALLSAASWEALQTLGTSYASHELHHASSVYGGFGLVLAAIAWLYAQALVLMLCAEVNMVGSHKLWPRALLTPFTDNVDLTAADLQAYRMHACTQRFKGFETIRADFDRQPHGPAQPHRPAHEEHADPPAGSPPGNWPADEPPPRTAEAEAQHGDHRQGGGRGQRLTGHAAQQADDERDADGQPPRPSQPQPPVHRDAHA